MTRQQNILAQTSRPQPGTPLVIHANDVGFPNSRNSRPSGNRLRRHVAVYAIFTA